MLCCLVLSRLVVPSLVSCFFVTFVFSLPRIIFPCFLLPCLIMSLSCLILLMKDKTFKSSSLSIVLYFSRCVTIISSTTVYQLYYIFSVVIQQFHSIIWFHFIHRLTKDILAQVVFSVSKLVALQAAGNWHYNLLSSYGS